jgi:hypothetical protein
VSTLIALSGGALALGSIGLLRRATMWCAVVTAFAGISLVLAGALLGGQKQVAGLMTVLLVILIVTAGTNWWNRRGKHGAR